MLLINDLYIVVRVWFHKSRCVDIVFTWSVLHSYYMYIIRTVSEKNEKSLIPILFWVFGMYTPGVYLVADGRGHILWVYIRLLYCKHGQYHLLGQHLSLPSITWYIYFPCALTFDVCGCAAVDRDNMSGVGVLPQL